MLYKTFNSIKTAINDGNFTLPSSLLSKINKKDLAPEAKAFELPLSDDFLDTFDIFRVTGDSGRGGHTIAKRERKKYLINF